MVEGVVESEGMILDVFGDAIYFVLRLVHSYLRVGCRNGIDFTVSLLLLENGSFPDADSQLNIGRSTLDSELETWGDRIFSRNLFLSIIISKSMSTFLPLAKL